LFANSFKLYEFGHRVVLPTRKNSTIDKAVQFFQTQFMSGPSLPSDNLVPSKDASTSLEDAIGPGPYRFIDGKEMSPDEIEHRLADLKFSVTTYIGDAPQWIEKLPTNYFEAK